MLGEILVEGQYQSDSNLQCKKGNSLTSIHISVSLELSLMARPKDNICFVLSTEHGRRTRSIVEFTHLFSKHLYSVY